VRPITALWPLVHVVAKEKRRAYLLLAFAPLLAWMSIVFVATGEFSMGRSGHDLGNNIYYRLQRIGGALPPAERPAVRPDGETKATLGALAFTLLMLFAVYGAARWARSPERLALVAFVIYIFATTQAVDAAQSRLRAPAEFAICLLAIAGWQALKRRARRHGG